LVSIIIPTLNEAGRIATLIEQLQALPGEKEILVVDGQSDDQTATLAEKRGATVITSPRGRGLQMHAGALAASGETLWFLHADSCPAIDSLAAIHTALADPKTVAGNFTLIFDGPSRAARHLTWLYPKLRWLGLSYGDAGIFILRTAYDAAQGFQPLPLFEDLDLIRRLKKLGRFAHLPTPLTTSSRRFEGRWGYLRAWAIWITLQTLYWLGVSPHLLVRWYRPVR